MTELRTETISTEIIQSVSTEQAWHYKIVPSDISDDTMVIYISEENQNTLLLQELSVIYNKRIKSVKIDEADLLILLNKYYRKSERTPASLTRNGEKTDDSLIKIIHEAYQLDSSDIHFEIYEHRCRVRLRIDGKLIEKYVIDKTEYPSLINKIKIRAKLDISEKRLPQDGRMQFGTQEDSFDIRVSVMPSIHGEKVVLRLLGKNAIDLDINHLGFSKTQLLHYWGGIRKTNGIILISGPTGSGKTTTLYSTLKVLNKTDINIITIEDPIEYTLPGINQVQLKENIGLTFAKALRTFLRQDPDIIMVGEIRDTETAQMAIRASLTGHLVLSTIHTNSAWGIVTRLIDMGLPPFLIASTLNLAVAQRLIRKLCPSCKKEICIDKDKIPNQFLQLLKDSENEAIPIGCDKCHFTGYSGRKAIYEVIPISNEVSRHIRDNKLEVVDYLRKNQIKSIFEQAIESYLNKETSMEEISPILLGA